MMSVSVTVPVIVQRTGRGNRLFLAYTMGFDACGEAKETEEAAIKSCLKAVRDREKILADVYGYITPQEGRKV